MIKLFIVTLAIIIILWGILPLIHTEVTKNNYDKNIQATAYIYSEIELKKDWAKE